MYNAKLVGCGMGMGFVPTWIRQLSHPLFHMTTLTTSLTWCKSSLIHAVVSTQWTDGL